MDEADEETLPAYSAASTIVEEDEEDACTPEDEKPGPLLDEDEDESGSYSPMEGSYHPTGLSRAVNRLTLDIGDTFELGSNSPDSPQSFQEILDIGSGAVTHSESSTSLPLKDDDDGRPTFL